MYYGVESKKFVTTKDDFTFEPEEYETVLITLIRSLIKKLPSNTSLAQKITAIEAEVFKI